MRAEVERRLSGGARETIEDVVGTATVWLLQRLRRLPGGESQIRDFGAYAAGLAAKATAQHIADQSPARARLRRKLRLLCASGDLFFLEEAGGRWLCGLREHQGREVAIAASVEQCRARLAAVLLPTDFP